MNTLESLWIKVKNIISIVNFPADIFDILIVMFLIYEILNFSKSRTAGKIIKAVVVLLAISYLSGALQLNTLNFLVSNAIEIGLVALIVVFQPELRRAMERLGGGSLKSLFVAKVQEGDTERTIDQTVQACRTMSRQKVGALIVFEREHNLEEYFKTGTVLDAAVSTELLKNVFFPKAALHDGAVIIRNDRLSAAGCVLPLTDNANLSRDLGTRHRAAIGISEHSDAVVVVVSEETGVISVAMAGNLRRYLTADSLTKLLKEELMEEAKLPVQHRVLEYFKKSKNEKEEDSHEAE